MMQYDAKLSGKQKLEHFKSLRRNRSSNNKLLNYETRRIFGEEVIAGEKVKHRAVIDFGDSETRESSVTIRNISANPDEKRKCRRRFSGYRIARV